MTSMSAFDVNVEKMNSLFKNTNNANLFQEL